MTDLKYPYTKEQIEQETNSTQFYFIVNKFQGKRNGFFIELGACDGILASNTYKLEKQYDWNGILIEPIKNYFDILQKERSCWYQYNVCIGKDNNSEVDFTRIEGFGKLLSGITNEYAKEQIERIKVEQSRRPHEIIHEKVKMRSLSSILENIGVSHIDYLSVDVEGGELGVLQSLNMEHSPIRPTIIGVENNYGSNDCYNYLYDFNYKFITRCGPDDMFEYMGGK